MKYRLKHMNTMPLKLLFGKRDQSEASLRLLSKPDSIPRKSSAILCTQTIIYINVTGKRRKARNVKTIGFD